MPQNKLIITIPVQREGFFSISLIFSLVSFVSAAVCLLRISYISVNIRCVVALPICYSIIYCIVRRRVSMSSPGMLTFGVVCFFRYVLTPLVVILTNQLNSISKDLNHIGEAVSIMIIEMVCLFVVALCYNPECHKNLDLEIKNPQIIKFSTIVVALLLIIDNRSLVGNLSLFTGLSAITGNEFKTMSGILSIFWQAICVFIFCFIMNTIAESRDSKKRLFLSLLTCLSYLLIIYTGQVSISRWYTIVTLVASICWLMKIYPSKKITIFLIIVVPACLVLLIATIVKNTNVGLGAGISTTIRALFNATNMDTYFAGPVNVNTAIAAKDAYNIGIESLFYDVLNNFPYLNHLIDRTNASANLFNSYLGRGDQIIPLVGQSFIWFSYYLTPLLSIISMVLVKQYDAKFIKTNSIVTYLYGFTAVWCALMPILNATIWLSWMYSRIIPAFILFKCVSRKKDSWGLENEC